MRYFCNEPCSFENRLSLQALNWVVCSIGRARVGEDDNVKRATENVEQRVALMRDGFPRSCARLRDAQLYRSAFERRSTADTRCVCVCVSQWKKVPNEWQARQATPAILQVSSSKHNANKITTRIRGPFHQSITTILTEEKEKRSSLLNLHMLQSTCFGT